MFEIWSNSFSSYHELKVLATWIQKRSTIVDHYVSLDLVEWFVPACQTNTSADMPVCWRAKEECVAGTYSEPPYSIAFFGIIAPMTLLLTRHFPDFMLLCKLALTWVSVPDVPEALLHEALRFNLRQEFNKLSTKLSIQDARQELIQADWMQRLFVCHLLVKWAKKISSLPALMRC